MVMLCPRKEFAIDDDKEPKYDELKNNGDS